jgi:thiamine biosynthesis lipoprotein
VTRLRQRRLLDALRDWRPAGRPRRVVVRYEHVLGTSLELQVVATDERIARRAEAEVLAEVDRLAAVLSGWSATSELARWLAAADVPRPVSPELAAVLADAERWRQRTGGAFDPAAEALAELLRTGGGPEAVAELASALAAERRVPLWDVDGARTARRRTRRPVSLDAIAKGYIVARAAGRAYAIEGVHDVLLNVGGDVQHRGARPVAVGVTDPFAPAENAPPIAVVRVQDAALATSGGYRRGFLLDGRHVSHIVDPRTGRPAERIASASVLAPDCATADALSTAFSVMSPHESVALADALPGVGCLLVDRDGAVVANDAWRAHAISISQHPSHSKE